MSLLLLLLLLVLVVVVVVVVLLVVVLLVVVLLVFFLHRHPHRHLSSIRHFWKAQVSLVVEVFIKNFQGPKSRKRECL